MPNDREEPANLLAKLAADTTLIVAIGSLLLYVFASSYVNEFVRNFGCKAEWFDPSIFQLISFSKNAILVAAILACGIWTLLEMRPFTSNWWMIYAGWLVVLAIVHALSALSPSETLPIFHLLSTIVVAVFPVVMGMIGLHQLRRAIEAGSAARNALQTADDTRAREIIEHSENKTTEELNRAGSHAKQRLDELEKKIALDDLELVELRRKRRLTIICMVAVTIYLTHYFSIMCGAGAAAIRFQSKEAWAVQINDETGQGIRIDVLFTDGVRTLSRRAEGDKISIVYHNPESDINLILRNVVAAKLVLPQPSTLPTTFP